MRRRPGADLPNGEGAGLGSGFVVLVKDKALGTATSLDGFHRRTYRPARRPLGAPYPKTVVHGQGVQNRGAVLWRRILGEPQQEIRRKDA